MVQDLVIFKLFMPSGSYERESRKLYNKIKTKDSVPFSIFASRLRRGLKIKDALFKKVRKLNKIEFPIIINGKKYKSIQEIADKHKINYGTLIARYYKGFRDSALIKKPRVRAFSTEEERINARRLRDKKYRIKNKEKRYAYTKEWFQKNPNYKKDYETKNQDKIKEYSKNYRLENKNKRNSYNSIWRRKNKGSPNSIWETVRSRFNNWLRNKNYKKRSEMSMIIGCSPKELKKHIQKKFKKGMTWKNHGDWHIDHIKPLAQFDPYNDKEIIKAFRFTNMQPLWKLENLRKSKKS